MIDDMPVDLLGAFNVYDHEIDNVGKQIAFLDRTNPDTEPVRLGTVYVLRLDPATGLPRAEPPVEIDRNATMSRQPGNGPEWAQSEAGTALYYTRVGPHGARGVRVSGLGGAPDGQALDWSEDIGAFEPSKSGEFAYPVVLYVDLAAGGGYWCEDRPGPHVRYRVPDAAVGAFLSGSPVRHVPDQRAIVMLVPDPASGVKKLVWRNLLRREDIIEEFEIARFSPETTVVSVNAVAAPNRNGPQGRAYVVYAIVDFAGILAWLVRVSCCRPEVESTYVHRLPDAANLYLTDDENFVDRLGEPYIAVTRSNDTSDFAYDSSDIWVVSAFPAGAPSYRQVTPPDSGGTRTERRDPEPMRLATGDPAGDHTYIYYRAREGPGPYRLRRAATGV